MKCQSAFFSRWLSVCLCLLSFQFLQAQGGVRWAKDGNSYYSAQGGELLQFVLPKNEKTVLLTKEQLTPQGQSPLAFRNFSFSEDDTKVLLFTNSKKVWRLYTRGDYWVYDRTAKTLKQIGKGRPASSLMFAKFSPDGSKVAYVSEYNIYVEDLASGVIKKLTTDGNRKLINGTFDWVYEEEFFCRDGFRWSPDSKQIAYWQIDAKNTKDYLMVNNTDSIYPFAVPVEYPVAGEAPSPFKIGVVNTSTAQTQWMSVPTDAVWQSYVPRLEWAGNSNELILQHLNRKQNESKILLCNAQTGAAQTIYTEKDSAWIDIQPLWDNDYIWGGWDWLNGGKEFIWSSEKDGWRHLYRVSRDGKKETLITAGNYDVMEITCIDEKGGFLYFMASPENATQKFLYRTKLDGKGKPERLSPATQQGTHDYDVSPNAKYAQHTFTNYYTRYASELISLADHKGLNGENKVGEAVAQANKAASKVEFFKVTTSEGVEMDAWMVKPDNFDATKKYPVVFYVYTEPWGQNVKDQFGVENNFLYQGSMAKDGYIYISIDNRGTPVPKGRNWRKVVYRKIGLVNIRDQALAATEILKWPFVDSSRVAVWGWSGGGSATLNLMFQYPEIYKTGIAVAAVGNQLTYDNIYQERYMGLPQENREDFVKGSPITYAKNLKGNLLYIHGTGDDNVHYNNVEMLVNELVKHNRQFQLMAYPNRTHSISEGAGTFQHLSTLYTNYLKQHCPPGGR
ncbi:DPP IV N-terminal domain-containing protein [Paraflavitalea sp. CAU 1676]|uniref:S9 family peptidase n=1 Tax=Paraflavitalea sp. CAU 1676 TaxID=3032598 RepID=UPI0023D9FAF3|nr:DPP IV N-terminal domain-containing protein [Paraflavitalea sp. CAU 1676]MDF2191730.1 DPP IV N-terminal domain-containing protein [Paraflavitalea sp. CAU 1676]